MPMHEHTHPLNLAKSAVAASEQFLLQMLDLRKEIDGRIINEEPIGKTELDQIYATADSLKSQAKTAAKLALLFASLSLPRPETNTQHPTLTDLGKFPPYSL